MNINLCEKILRCPITNESLAYSSSKYIEFKENGYYQKSNVEGVFKNESMAFMYPVLNGIILLLDCYAIDCNTGQKVKVTMQPDRERVFDYYNEISFILLNRDTVYGDSLKFLDYREITKAYLSNSFRKVGEYIPKKGYLYVDVGSGPIGLPEYIELSKNYDYRVCVDLSINALYQA